MQKIQMTLAQEILIKFFDHHNKRNLEGMLGLIKEDASLWRTQISNFCIGRSLIEEQIQKEWRQFEKSEINIEYFIPTAPDALWAAAISSATAVVDGQEYNFTYVRGSIVIQPEAGKWKIAHMHYSISV